ncbi:MAG TPA: hypothetical protein VLJ79_05010 [Candidatus Binatia bacterium]|nr:hypothetical protein [Candidatus Binatia bacterium]
MDSQLMIIIIGVALVVIVLVAAGAWTYAKTMRSRRLKAKFGPEYGETVERLRNRELAERELEEREQRVKRFHIVPLSTQDRSQYREGWTAVQGRFVDDPKAAVEEAHQLVHEVMKNRGYPVTGFDQAAADLSVEYPTFVTHYRAASRIAANNRKGIADTEELRQALVNYRALFEELLEVPQTNEQPRRKARFQFKKVARGGLRT